MCRELLSTFLPVRIAVESEIRTLRDFFRFGQNSSKSQQTPGTEKTRDFEKRSYRVSRLNSVCRDLLRTFLPVRITVESEIRPLRDFFRFGQNSSKSPARLRAQVKYRRFRKTTIPCVESCRYRDSYMPLFILCQKRGRMWRPEADKKKLSDKF